MKFFFSSSLLSSLLLVSSTNAAGSDPNSTRVDMGVTVANHDPKDPSLESSLGSSLRGSAFHDVTHGVPGVNHRLDSSSSLDRSGAGQSLKISDDSPVSVEKDTGSGIRPSTGDDAGDGSDGGHTKIGELDVDQDSWPSFEAEEAKVLLGDHGTAGSRSDPTTPNGSDSGSFIAAGSDEKPSRNDYLRKNDFASNVDKGPNEERGQDLFGFVEDKSVETKELVRGNASDGTLVDKYDGGDRFHLRQADRELQGGTALQLSSFCWRESRFRGTGFWPTTCEEGYEDFWGRCLEPCPDGYEEGPFLGKGVCYQLCPEGMEDSLSFPITPSCSLNNGNVPVCHELGLGKSNGMYGCEKNRKNRKFVQKSCPEGFVKEGILCHFPCPNGYKNAGSFCEAGAPPGWVLCGLGAAASSSDCGGVVLDQIIAPIDAIKDTVEAIATAGVSVALDAAEKPLDVAVDSENFLDTLADLKMIADLKILKKKLDDFVDTYNLEEMIENVEELKEGYDMSVGTADALVTEAWAKLDKDETIRITVADAIRMASGVASLFAPDIISSWIDVAAAYAYPVCSEYFEDNNGMTIDSYTIQIDCAKKSEESEIVVSFADSESVIHMLNSTVCSSGDVLDKVSFEHSWSNERDCPLRSVFIKNKGSERMDLDDVVIIKNDQKTQSFGERTGKKRYGGIGGGAIVQFEFGEELVDTKAECKKKGIQWKPPIPDIYQKNGEECNIFKKKCWWEHNCLDTPTVPFGFGRCSDGEDGSLCNGHRHCKSERCRNHKCMARLRNGLPCYGGVDCASDFCSMKKKCIAAAKNTESCGPGRHCEKGLECLMTRQICTDGEDGSPCNVVGDCKSMAATSFPCTCIARGKNGEFCDDFSRKCDGNMTACLPNFIGKDRKCTDGEVGSACTLHKHCLFGNSCSNKKCVEGLEVGAPCDANNECSTRRCERDGLFEKGTCEKLLQVGESCNENSDCASQSCVGGIGAKRCIEKSDSGGKCGGLSGMQCKDGLTCLGSQRCTSGEAGSKCYTVAGIGSGGCKEGLVCDVPVHVPFTGRNTEPTRCMPKAGLGERCTKKILCENDLTCVGQGINQAKLCTDEKIGSPCLNRNHCDSNACIDRKCRLPAKNKEECKSGTIDCAEGLTCITGKVFKEICTDGAVGSPCTGPDHCDSGSCNAIFAGECLPPRKNGESCGNMKKCESGLECLAVTQRCTDGKVGSLCTTDGNCDSGWCPFAWGKMTCKEKPAQNGEKCGPDRPCSNVPPDMKCVVLQLFGDHRCTDKNLGSPCVAPTDCHSGSCDSRANKCVARSKNGESCAGSLKCANSLKCAGKTCTDGKVGSNCVSNGHCDSDSCYGKKCYAPAKNGQNCGPSVKCAEGLDCLAGKQVCTDGKEDSKCTVHTDCDSKKCFQNKCQSWGAGSYCVASWDCNKSHYCSGNSCTAKRSYWQTCGPRKPCKPGLKCTVRFMKSSVCK